MSEPRRDRWGQPQIVPPGGGDPVSYKRASNFASPLEDRWALENWGKRNVARGMASRPDILARVAAAGDDDKALLDTLCKQAVEAAAGSAGANSGQALHEATARIDLGQKVTLPSPLDRDLLVYQAALADHGISVVPGMIERFVVNDEFQAAGSFDRIVSFGSRLWVADLKTGRTLDYSWPSIAIQLAIYAEGQFYDNGKRTPLPAVDQDVAVVIHLPSGQGRCELHFLDIAAGREGARLAIDVRRWRARRDLAQPWSDGTAVTVPEVRRARLAERIEALRGVDGALDLLARRWPSGVATLKQSIEHSSDELDAVALAISTVEASGRAPFGELDPADSL